MNELDMHLQKTLRTNSKMYKKLYDASSFNESLETNILVHQKLSMEF